MVKFNIELNILVLNHCGVVSEQNSTTIVLLVFIIVSVVANEKDEWFNTIVVTQPMPWR